jgi:CRISPR/Cas system-associated endonuclease/helicase Cas3
MLLAHSADKKNNIPEQSYADHIKNVVSIAYFAASNAAKYAASNGKTLEHVVQTSGEYHDLGKLDEENQKVLSGINKAKNLPIQHTEAGTAYLLQKNEVIPAVLARSHHIGLPDWPHEENRSELAFRDENENVRNIVTSKLDWLCELHNSTVNINNQKSYSIEEFKCNPQLFMRIALSCLADGDHTDTAKHYKKFLKKEKPDLDLMASERLTALDKYVSGLTQNNDRSLLRAEMYKQCRDSQIEAGIASCDSPVGTGKTTAVMAHMLAQADKRKLRRIFIVLPFINIITQSVEVYRKALVLPGENPEEVVAELHYQADFKDINSRHLTALWKAPIIVTTAVTFFETLASNKPSTLRKLHNLPGSAIFVDESHAALPAKLYPLAWQWMKYFASEWNCYWTLASGSLNRFWQIPEFDDNPPKVPEIVSDDLRNKLLSYEHNRINYKYKTDSLKVNDLSEWIKTLPGPRILILNTVQSAAVVALELSKKYGRGSVEHLSTSLTPIDRTATLKRIKSRLKNNHYETNGDWTLVATSCIEAGVDISFKTGIRELGSLVSLLQTSGRVNRNGIIEGAEVWTIRLSEDGFIKLHPGMKESANVLNQLFEEHKMITPDLCTEALKREIRLIGSDLEKLKKAELEMRFPTIEKEFKVINTDTRIVVIDKDIIQRIERHENIDWLDIQKGSVQIWGYKLEKLGIQEFKEKPGLYKWILDYDGFLGYMAGVLSVERDIQNSSETYVI